MWPVTLLTAAFMAVAAYEIAQSVKRRTLRELGVALIILITAYIYALLVTIGRDLPTPLHFIRCLLTLLSAV